MENAFSKREQTKCLGARHNIKLANVSADAEFTLLPIWGCPVSIRLKSDLLTLHKQTLGSAKFRQLPQVCIRGNSQARFQTQQPTRRAALSTRTACLYLKGLFKYHGGPRIRNDVSVRRNCNCQGELLWFHTLGLGPLLQGRYVAIGVCLAATDGCCQCWP